MCDSQLHQTDGQNIDISLKQTGYFDKAFKHLTQFDSFNQKILLSFMRWKSESFEMSNSVNRFGFYVEWFWCNFFHFELQTVNAHFGQMFD